jgi:pimeloyl-ACP methyl ester carboxylesterase
LFLSHTLTIAHNKEMAKPLHVIYIPGHGDYAAQRRIVSRWRLWGVKPELYPINWGDKQPWSIKRDALLARIDELARAGSAVALVGVSAGASAAINLYAARPDKTAGVVCIVGWINYPEDLHLAHMKKNPAFVESAKQSPVSLASLSAEQRRHILSRCAIYDRIVNKRHSRVDGARNQIVPSVGHSFTIATQIIFGAPSFLRFLKRLTLPNLT